VTRVYRASLRFRYLSVIAASGALTTLGRTLHAWWLALKILRGRSVIYFSRNCEGIHVFDPEDAHLAGGEDSERPVRWTVEPGNHNHPGLLTNQLERTAERSRVNAPVQPHLALGVVKNALQQALPGLLLASAKVRTRRQATGSTKRFYRR
jgi:hypothetical protein